MSHQLYISILPISPSSLYNYTLPSLICIALYFVLSLQTQMILFIILVNKYAYLHTRMAVTITRLYMIATNLGNMVLLERIAIV